jgi:hypothetical protein
VKQTDGSWKCTVSGTWFSNIAVPDPVNFDVNPPVIIDQTPYIASGRYFDVTLESNTGPAPTTTDDIENELGWTQVFRPHGDEPPFPAVITLAPQMAPNLGPVTFTGVMPTFTRVAGTRYRLVVREWEMRQTDLTVSPGGGYLKYGDADSVPTRNALVYTDIFQVT